MFKPETFLDFDLQKTTSRCHKQTEKNVPGDDGEKLKESENMNKYQELERKQTEIVKYVTVSSSLCPTLWGRLERFRRV